MNDMPPPQADAAPASAPPASVPASAAPDAAPAQAPSGPASAGAPPPPIAGGIKVTLGEVLNEISAYERDGKLDLAEDLAERVLRAAPNHAHVLHLSGIVAYRRGKIDLAIERMERSMELSPEVPVYPRNMCEIYRGAGRLDDALRVAHRAIELAPEDSRAHFNHALIRYERLELNDALAAADRAIELDANFPEAHFERAEILLLAGQLTPGWESYEWRFKLKQAEGMLPKTDKPQWDGGPLPEGRLLIVADQGFGDCIQFGRYIPWLAERAPKPVLACSGDLVPILKQINGIGRIVTRWEATGDFDAYIPLSGLPRLAGTTIDTIPATIPYLHPDPAKIAAWRQQLDALTPRHKKRIGLVWAGRPTHKNDRKRTVKLRQFAPLFARPDIAIVTVQKGDRIDEVGQYFGPAPLVNLGPTIQDFTDTLAIMQSLDRLVTIDTSVAHLAGASGVATSLILPFAPDWRWLHGRDDTPWYPSIKLYRQQRPYDWSGVVERLAAEI
ncbi:hypothetical protein ACOSOMT5_P0328 [Acidiphilium sp. MT5]